MKKHLNILSLAVLLIYNSIYTAESGKPLTAQEKIRANTLLVRQKHLNVDIQRLKDQGKNVPASMTKDSMNITNVINAYEVRDPVAVTDIKKGITPAAHIPTKPSISTPESVEKTFTAPDLSFEQSIFEIEEKKEEKPSSIPVLSGVEKPDSEKAPRLLKDKKLDLETMELYEKEIKTLPIQYKETKIKVVLDELSKELDEEKDLTLEIKDQIYKQAKNRLNSLLPIPAASTNPKETSTPKEEKSIGEESQRSDLRKTAEQPTAPINKPIIEKPRPVLAPSPVLEAKSTESNVKWDNLDAFIAKNENPLNRTNLTDRIINTQWRKNAFDAIKNDLSKELKIFHSKKLKKDIPKRAIQSPNEFIKNKEYEQYVVSTLFKKVQENINALSNTDQIKKDQYSKRALNNLIFAVTNDLNDRTEDRIETERKLKEFFNLSEEKK